MQASYDVIIIGGGVIGSAIACFLAAAPFGGSVLVVERDRSYQTCSTTRSAGGIRQQFSTPENIAISQFGAAFLKRAADHLGVEGEAPALSFVEAGYLFLATPAGLPVLHANHAVQRAHGAEVALLSPAALAERFPWLAVGDLAGGSLGLADEGWFDPAALLHGFRCKARSLGVTYVEDEVIGLDRMPGRAGGRAGARLTGVRLRAGGVVGCGVAVNAAGPGAASVAAMAGIALPVRPRKRFVFVFRCRTPLPGCPLVIDPSGAYFRPEGTGFLCGISPAEEDDPDCLDLEVDHGLFERVLWPLLAARVPAFEAVRPAGAWAGLYDVNTFDRNAILGPHPELGNFLFANGFSGHGLQQSPAVGRAISELILHGRYRTLDLSRLGFERLIRGERLAERNIV